MLSVYGLYKYYSNVLKGATVNIQELLDDREIQLAHVRYAIAHDTRDFETLRSVFAPNVEANYGSQIVLHNVEQVIANVKVI